MFKIMKFDSHKQLFWAPLFAFVLGLSLLTGCNDTSPTSSTSSITSSNPSEYEVAGDHAIGNANAPITVVEYASVVCGACANWHINVYPELKKKYIDTGHVRYIFREFPTEPRNLAYAGFTIANCAGEDKFLSNISLQFQRQAALLGAQDRRKAYENLAKASGLSITEYETCRSDPQWRKRYETIIQDALDMGVNATPTFFVNGQKSKVFTIEDFQELLDPMLGQLSDQSSTQTLTNNSSDMADGAEEKAAE